MRFEINFNNIETGQLHADIIAMMIATGEAPDKVSHSWYNKTQEDLIFFDASRKRKGIDHVGIYLGGGKFVHSVSGKGVVIQRLMDFRHPAVYGKRVLS